MLLNLCFSPIPLPVLLPAAPRCLGLELGAVRSWSLSSLPKSSDSEVGQSSLEVIEKGTEWLLAEQGTCAKPGQGGQALLFGLGACGVVVVLGAGDL